MVMESISPQCVGKEFVRQYYTVLNKAPLHLHRFYSDDSSFVHGGLDQSDEDPVVGQQNIHQKIMQLNFRDCHAKIRQVDAHSTLKNGVVVQVIGELSNNGEPMRQFMQTFVLAPQTPKKYYVRNDIFRYQDEDFIEDEDYETAPDTNLPPVLKLQSLHLQAEKDMDDQITTAAPDSRDNNNYYEKDYIRNGTSHLNENEHLSLNSLNVTSNNNNNNINSNPVSLAPSQTLSSLGSTVVDLSAAQPHVDVSSTHSLPQQREGEESPCKSDWEDSAEEEEEEEEEEDEEEEEEEPVTESSVTADQQQQSILKSDIHISEMDDMGTQSILTPEPKTYANMVSKNTPPSGIPGSHLPGPPLGTPFTNLASQQPSAQQQTQPQPPPPQTQQQQQVSPNSAMLFSGSKQGTDFPKLDHHVHQQQQQQQSVSPNSFPGSGYRGMTRPMRYTHRNVNGRMHNSDSTGGNTGGGASFTSSSSNRYNDDSGSEGVMEKRKPINYYQDSQQVFVGNLPHEIGFDDLKEIFQKFGPVVDMRINNKQNQKMGPSGKSPVPNYGFVVFEDEETVQKVLQNKPILYGQHRLNVEEKKAKPRDMGDRIMSSGRGGMMMRHLGGGMSRGGGPRGGMRGSDRGRGGPNYSNNRR